MSLFGSNAPGMLLATSLLIAAVGCDVRVQQNTPGEDERLITASSGDIAGAQITVPAGAHDDGDAFTITEGEAPGVDDTIAQYPLLGRVGPAVKMRPAGVEFKAPVTIAVPFSIRQYNELQDQGKLISILAQDESGAVRLDTGPVTLPSVSLDTGPVTLEGGWAGLDTGPVTITANERGETFDALFVFEVTHFTTFQVVALRPCEGVCEGKGACAPNGCGRLCPPEHDYQLCHASDILEQDGPVILAPQAGTCKDLCGYEIVLDDRCDCHAGCTEADTCCDDFCPTCAGSPVGDAPEYNALCCEPSCGQLSACQDDGCGGWCPADWGQICPQDLVGTASFPIEEPSCELACGLEVVGDHCDCHPGCVDAGTCCEDLCALCEAEVDANESLEAYCCEPQCEDKGCGDNGCGGTCGECDASESCDESGVCVCVPQCHNVFPGEDDGCEGACPGPGTCDDSFATTCQNGLKVKCSNDTFEVKDCEAGGGTCGTNANGKIDCLAPTCEHSACNGDAFTTCVDETLAITYCATSGLSCKNDSYGHGNCTIADVQPGDACANMGAGFCDGDTLWYCDGTDWYSESCADSLSTNCKANDAGDMFEGATCFP